MRSWAAAVGVVLAILVSGCSGAKAGDEAGSAEPSATVGFGDPIPDAGSLQGTVVDDSSAPIGGATVALDEGTVSATTGDDGSFKILNLAPGSHKVFAQKLGYESTAKAVTIEANSAATIVITLIPIAVEVSYHDTWGPLQGYFECAVGTPARIVTCGATAPQAFPNDKNRLSFTLKSEKWATFVGELRWQPAAAATSQYLAAYMSYEGRAGTHWWCASDGKSPNSFRYESGDGESVCSDQGDQKPEPSTKLKMFMQSDTGFGGLTTDNPPARATVQQHYEALMTIFYGDPAPDPYTGFPDG